MNNSGYSEAPGFGLGDEVDDMPSTEKDLAEDAPWKKIQQNTFTRWCNEHLKCVGKRLTDLQRDLSDGLRLIALLEVLSQKRMYRKFHPRPNFRQMKLENVSVALEFLEREHIKLVSIGQCVRRGGSTPTRGWPMGTGCSGLGGRAGSRGRAEGGGPGTGRGSCPGSPEGALPSYAALVGRHPEGAPRGHPAQAVSEPSSFRPPRTLLANLLLPARLLFCHPHPQPRLERMGPKLIADSRGRPLHPRQSKWLPSLPAPPPGRRG